LRAVTLVYKDVQIALGLETGRQGLFHFFNESLNVNFCITVALAAELVNERADQPRRGIVQCRDKIGTAFRTINLFIDALEHALNLFVEFRTVCDDEHAGLLYVFPYPLGEPHHGQALPRALSVPKDAAFPTAHRVWSRLRAEILIVAADLLGPGIEHDEVVNDFQ